MRISKHLFVLGAVLILQSAGQSGFAAAPAAPVPTVHKVGAITWHAKAYAAQTLTIKGYVLAQEAGYLLFSDEPTGAISAHDLPVTGSGTDQLPLEGKFLLTGRFILGGLKASNGNPYHLELTAPPVASSP